MENLTCQKDDAVTEDVEMKEENEPTTKTEMSVAQTERFFILEHDPGDIFYDEDDDDGFNYEEEEESNNKAEFDSSCHGDNSNVKYEQDEKNSNYDEYDDPLAQHDALDDVNEDESQKQQQQQQSETNSESSTKIINPSLQQEEESWKFSCPNCPAHFSSYEELVEHEKIPHDPQLLLQYKKSQSPTGKLVRKSRPWQCLLCFIWAPGEKELSQHLRSHAGKSPHFCPCCQNTQSETKTTGSPIFSSSYFEDWLVHINENHKDRLHIGKHFPPIPIINLPFTCTLKYCWEKFGSDRELKEHLKLHTSTSKSRETNSKSEAIFKAFQCSHLGCGMEFTTSVALDKHKKKFHNSKSAFQLIFTCGQPGCSLQFKTKGKRDAHWEKEHDVSFICPEKEIGCSMEFFTQRDFDNHTRAHKLPPPVTWEFVCRYCSPRRPFPSESSLEEHFQVKHALSCPFDLLESDSGSDCPPFFQSVFMRDLHMLEKHDCPIESSQYPTLSAASSFLRCNHDNCSIQFKTQLDLRAHIKEEKHKDHTYNCPAFNCPQSTTNPSSFLSHFVHLPHHDPCNPDFQPGENPWACPICQDSDKCQSPTTLQKHAVEEHKFLNFPCSFVRPENPNDEESCHGDSENKPKPMKCGMIFDTFNQLKLHWKYYSEHFPHDPKLWLDWLKTPIPIKCSRAKCSKEFKSQSEMTAHFVSHFPSEEQIPKYIVDSGLLKRRPRGQRYKQKDKRKEQKEPVEEPQEEELPSKRRVGPPKRLEVDNAPVQKPRNIKVEKRRGRGRPKKLESENIVVVKTPIFTKNGKRRGRPRKETFVHKVEAESEPEEETEMGIDEVLLIDEMDNSD